MRLRAGVGLLCAALAGCQHLPDDVTIDVGNRTVTVGSCQCRLPAPDEKSAPEADEPR